MNRLKRLVRQSNGVKPRYIQEMLNQIHMGISAEHRPKSSIEMCWNFPSLPRYPFNASTVGKAHIAKVLTRRKVFPCGVRLSDGLRDRLEFLIIEDARNSTAAIPDSVSYARAFALRDRRLAWHPFATPFMQRLQLVGNLTCLAHASNQQRMHDNVLSPIR